MVALFGDTKEDNGDTDVTEVARRIRQAIRQMAHERLRESRFHAWRERGHEN